jgi:hypothetical protein
MNMHKFNILETRPMKKSGRFEGIGVRTAGVTYAYLLLDLIESLEAAGQPKGEHVIVAKKAQRAAAVMELCHRAREIGKPLALRFKVAQRKGTVPKRYVVLNGAAAKALALPMANDLGGEVKGLLEHLDKADIVLVEEREVAAKVSAMEQTRRFMAEIKAIYDAPAGVVAMESAMVD